MEIVYVCDFFKKSDYEGEEKVKQWLEGEIGWRQNLFIFYLF